MENAEFLCFGYSESQVFLVPKQRKYDRFIPFVALRIGVSSVVLIANIKN